MDENNGATGHNVTVKILFARVSTPCSMTFFKYKVLASRFSQFLAETTAGCWEDAVNSPCKNVLWGLHIKENAMLWRFLNMIEIHILCRLKTANTNELPRNGFAETNIPLTMSIFKCMFLYQTDQVTGTS